MKTILSEYGRTLAGGLVMIVLLLVIQLPVGDILNGPLRQREELNDQASKDQDRVVDQEISNLRIDIVQLRDCLVCGEEILLKDLIEATRPDGTSVPLKVIGFRYRKSIHDQWQVLTVDCLQTPQMGICPTNSGIYQLLVETDNGPRESMVVTFAANRIAGAHEEV